MQLVPATRDSLFGLRALAYPKIYGHRPRYGGFGLLARHLEIDSMLPWHAVLSDGCLFQLAIYQSKTTIIMNKNKLKLEELQIKGFITDLTGEKSKTHNFLGGWRYNTGGGGGSGPGRRSHRCDDWGTEEGTRACTDARFCESDYCPTEYPGCA